ncbi:MAG TPA: ABC transporter substrate-binding protein [Arachnia sp.]|nr:ABC transporter substrate-binding protein [Arachnia sp.]HMT86076.1 ABC transporter substrate-binding protein [Arachnia sp.]
MTTPRRTRRAAAAAAAILSATLVLTACGSDPEETPADNTGATSQTPTGDAGTASETRTITADNGTIEVPANPQRIVTIGNTTLTFIDLGGKPVGVTEVRDSALSLIPEDQQATYAAATVLASSADEVDMEQLASLEPDLILAQFPATEFEPLQKQLESIAPTAFWGLDVEWKALADGLAEAGNVGDALSAQKAEFERRVAEIQETYRTLIDDTAFVEVTRWSNADPGTFSITDFGCVEIARDDIGMNFPEAAEGEDPLGWTALPFEQISSLSDYDVITYPVDAEGNPTEAFQPVVETNTWKELPEVKSGHALGVFCPGNSTYGPVLRYLDSLDAALATLPATE